MIDPNKIIKRKVTDPIKPIEITLKGVKMVAIKGDKGEKPSNEELTELIKPLIPVVKDGKDADETKIVKDVLSKIPKPKDGVDGKSVDEEKVVERITKSIPIPKDGANGKDGSPDTVEEISTKINSKYNHIDFRVLNNIPDFALAKDVSSGGGGITPLKFDNSSGSLISAYVTDLQFGTGLTPTYSNGKITLVASGVTGSSDSSLTIAGNDAIINTAHTNNFTATQTITKTGQLLQLGRTSTLKWGAQVSATGRLIWSAVGGDEDEPYFQVGSLYASVGFFQLSPSLPITGIGTSFFESGVTNGEGINTGEKIATFTLTTSTYNYANGSYTHVAGTRATFTDPLFVTNITPSGIVVKRTVSVSDATSITPNSDTTDVLTQINTQAIGTLTMNAPTGSPIASQTLLIRIKSTNVQTFSWNAAYRNPTGGALPTATTGGGNTNYYNFIRNADDSKWDYLS